MLGTGPLASSPIAASPVGFENNVIALAGLAATVSLGSAVATIVQNFNAVGLICAVSCGTMLAQAGTTVYVELPPASTLHASLGVIDVRIGKTVPVQGFSLDAQHGLATGHGGVTIRPLSNLLSAEFEQPFVSTHVEFDFPSYHADISLNPFTPHAGAGFNAPSSLLDAQHGLATGHAGVTFPAPGHQLQAAFKKPTAHASSNVLGPSYLLAGFTGATYQVGSVIVRMPTPVWAEPHVTDPLIQGFGSVALSGVLGDVSWKDPRIQISTGSDPAGLELSTSYGTLAVTQGVNYKPGSLALTLGKGVPSIHGSAVSSALTTFAESSVGVMKFSTATAVSLPSLLAQTDLGSPDFTPGQTVALELPRLSGSVTQPFVQASAQFQLPTQILTLGQGSPLVTFGKTTALTGLQAQTSLGAPLTQAGVDLSLSGSQLTLALGKPKVVGHMSFELMAEQALYILGNSTAYYLLGKAEPIIYILGSDDPVNT